MRLKDWHVDLVLGGTDIERGRTSLESTLPRKERSQSLASELHRLIRSKHSVIVGFCHDVGVFRGYKGSYKTDCLPNFRQYLD